MPDATILKKKDNHKVLAKRVADNYKEVIDMCNKQREDIKSLQAALHEMQETARERKKKDEERDENLAFLLSVVKDLKQKCSGAPLQTETDDMTIQIVRTHELVDNLAVNELIPIIKDKRVKGAPFKRRPSKKDEIYKHILKYYDAFKDVLPNPTNPSMVEIPDKYNI